RLREVGALRGNMPWDAAPASCPYHRNPPRDVLRHSFFPVGKSRLLSRAFPAMGRSAALHVPPATTRRDDVWEWTDPESSTRRSLQAGRGRFFAARGREGSVHQWK